MTLYIVAHTLGSRYDDNIEIETFSSKEAAENHAIDVLEGFVSAGVGKEVSFSSLEKARAKVAEYGIEGTIVIESLQLDEAGMRRAYDVERVEWVPVRYRYRIEANSPADAAETLAILDEGRLETSAVERICGTRRPVEVCDIHETSGEVDEMDYWKIDGIAFSDLGQNTKGARR